MFSDETIEQRAKSRARLPDVELRPALIPFGSPTITQATPYRVECGDAVSFLFLFNSATTFTQTVIVFGDDGPDFPLPPLATVNVTPGLFIRLPSGIRRFTIKALTAGTFNVRGLYTAGRDFLVLNVGPFA